MHDDLIERRLRTMLRDEADRQPFTITAAELERRVALGGRAPGERRLTLLLAAAVGIGALGVGGFIGGLANRSLDPSPVPTQATATAPADSDSPPATLASLDAMIATRDPGSVVLAHAHSPLAASVGEPAAQAFGDPPITLGPLSAGEYEVDFACSGGRGGAVLSGPGLPGAAITRPCDNALHQSTVGLVSRRNLELILVDAEAWRVVVRRVGGAGAAPGGAPALLPDAGTLENLSRVEELTILDGPAWPGTDFAFTEVDGLPGRLGYVVDVSCVGSSALRYIFGDEIDRELVSGTATQIPCDGTLHHAELRLARPLGTRLYVAADAGATVSLMVRGEQPPVGLVQEQPGWQLSAGTGPNLAFDAHTQAFTGPGVEGGGPVLIAVSCAGTASIEVSVRLHRAAGQPVTEEVSAQFDARCDPDGATTSESFASADEYVDVEYTTTAGTWVAVSILVPDPLPSPR